MGQNLPVLESLLSTESYALIESLTNAFGPSGCEEAVAKILRDTVTPYADEVRIDRMGNVIALYRGIEDAADAENPRRQESIRPQRRAV